MLLGSEVNEKIQAYIRYMVYVRESGGSISSRLIIAGTKGITLSSNCSLLAKYRGPVTLTRTWAHSLLSGIKIVKRNPQLSDSNHNQRISSRSNEILRNHDNCPIGESSS